MSTEPVHFGDGGVVQVRQQFSYRPDPTGFVVVNINAMNNGGQA